MFLIVYLLISQYFLHNIPNETISLIFNVNKSRVIYYIKYG